MAPAASVGASRPAMRAGAALIARDERGQVELAGFDEPGVKHAEGRLEADAPEGRLLVGHVLLLRDVRGVVGGDAVDEAAPERLDERPAVALGAQRRVHLEVGVERGDTLVVQGEMVRRDLRRDPDARLLGARDRLERRLGADVTDVQVGVLVGGDVERA